MDYNAIFQKYSPRRENLLMILHEIQESEPRRYIPAEAMDRVAEYINTTRAGVYGVVGYYSMLSAEPRGRRIIRVCTSPVCRMMGSADLLDVLRKRLGIELGETTPDGSFTLESSECLGNCHHAPSMMIDEVLYSKVTRDSLGEILEHARKGEAAHG